MIELQRKLLGDRVRNTAFYEALRKVVQKNCSVVDIGSGTGFLSFLAQKIGAGTCTLYESSKDMLSLSQKLAQENSIKNCQFVCAHSTQVRSPAKADIVMAEVLGNYALEEHIIEIMEDAKRFLKEGGTLMPQVLTQYVMPVTGDRLQQEIDVWPNIGFELTWNKAREICLQNMYVKTLRPSDLPPQNEARAWDTIDFRKKQQSKRQATVEWQIKQDRTIHGFCLFWECEIVPGVMLSTSPFCAPTHWEQIYLPLLSPLTLKNGSVLTLSLTSDTRPAVGVRVTWQASILQTDGGVKKGQMMDSYRGFMP